ncbi:NAD(P)-binding protein [Guyanagaster necrorhizus]|uniref:NAD(P)-binding protein n=1 Tax=Guyanagaster necrorhizus TaxID=856835 RepID=A0A9P7VZX8_9AGAR|nr:NAD(P)-binding protein [Guyanagaster necrorhizus MCA 3950]KAG7450039.1 NAD(P)-binding protein [Guyanagaster necrorhizus MCA 3950]
MSTLSLDNLRAVNLFDLRGTVVVITGGGSGIGLMISSTLIANGATVYIVGPSQADLDQTCDKFNAAAANIPGAGTMYGIEGDIRLKSEAKRLADEVGKRERHVTALFNNAGILKGSFKRPTASTASAYVSSFFDDITQESFNDTLNTNAVGPYWLTFAFLPLLEKWKLSDDPATKKFGPQIIMTSSMNGWTKDSSTAGFSYPYMFSKSAIGHATSSVAHELLPLGIRVNGIAPGLFPSAMSFPGAPIDESGVVVVPPDTKIDFEVPVEQGWGKPRDVGSLALFLLANWYVTGETVLIDGGTLLKHPSSY